MESTDELITPPRDMTRDEAAVYISTKHFPCKSQTLANLATAGNGPAFRKAGQRTLYSKDDCDRWAGGKMTARVRCTAELTAAA